MKNRRMKYPLAVVIFSLFVLNLPAARGQETSEQGKNVRERILMDFDWQFAFGHPTDPAKDYGTGTGYFSYLAKTGYGDGAAAAGFDDRTWRTVDLPHDWAAEAPFDARGSHSHGYKAVGRNFPEASVGWYRKTFSLPADDKGKRISLEFDGVCRDARVWVNGFYCGNEPSGYYGFSFDITDFLNYGGENVVAVRTDVSLEEGWFYEGAGIYRHVWLNKTRPLHVPQNGTWVIANVENKQAQIIVHTKVYNQKTQSASFYIEQTVKDHNDNTVCSERSAYQILKPFEENEYTLNLNFHGPRLWSLEDPYRYVMLTRIVEGGKMVDSYETPFGIRTLRFDPEKGFFLNEESVKLLGTTNHQDHAGVGCAIPDALNEWRIRQLKSMGSNTYRTSHNPPTPELLDICDRLGMLVIDENRLMGTSEMHLDYLRRLIERDRNHPSVILWSIGNEEWAIEGNERGADMAASMQAFARSIDPTRPVNAAISGGWGQGISTVIEVMGYNYLNHGDTDQHHERFPGQSSLGTEEGSTNTTRGIYFDDPEKQYLAAYDRPTPSGFLSYHTSWNHYASRDYLAGVCYWTGFDYRGESTPFGWPSVSSYFGIFDLCGFPKDNYYYLKSWWSREPVLHILPHWNWPGKEGDEVDVVVYSNFDEVELYRNGQSQGKKTMEKNGSLMWKVPYQPGELKALGYKNGILTGEKRVVTSSEPASLALSADRTRLKADRQDVSVISVSLTDAMGNPVPNANIPVSFSVEGPGKIIGVGNGDPTSHENDRFIEKALSLSFGPWKEIPADETRVEEALQPGYNDATWERAFPRGSNEPGVQPVKKIYRSHFSLSADDLEAKISWMFNSIGKEQSVYVNGKLLGKNLGERERNHTFVLNREILHVGENTVAIVAIPYVKAHQWDNVNTRPGLVQILIPAPRWERSTFNGLAQVLLQTGDTKGIIVLKANAGGLNPASITLVAE